MFQKQGGIAPLLQIALEGEDVIARHEAIKALSQLVLHGAQSNIEAVFA